MGRVLVACGAALRRVAQHRRDSRRPSPTDRFDPRRSARRRRPTNCPNARSPNDSRP